MPLPAIGLLVNQGFSLAKKHKVGAKLLAWGKKGFSLTGGQNGVNLKASGVNMSIGSGGTSGTGTPVAGFGGLSPIMMAGIGIVALLLFKK